MMVKKLIVLSCLFLAGCASFYVAKLDEAKEYPPTNSADVVILRQAPEKPYIVIGEVRAEGETLSLEESMEQRLKEKAAAIGADAVILRVKEDTYRIRDEGVIVGHTYGFNLNRLFTKKMAGQIIRYKNK